MTQIFSSYEEIIKKVHYNVDDTEYDNDIKSKILDIFNGYYEETQFDNILIFLWIGIYHEKITKNYELMKKYYLMAIEKGCSIAMKKLGYYYNHIEINYDLMEKYYLMAIEKGDENSMNFLGIYYKNIGNYDLMKKYYLMAVEKDDKIAMYNLGYYYEDIEKNYDLMKKYYLMAIEKGEIKSMYYLGNYYKKKEKNYDLMKEYYLMAVEKDYVNAMHSLGIYYKSIEKNYDLMKKYYLMAIEKGCMDSIKNFKNVVKILEFYVSLKSINIKNDLINTTIRELNNNPEIIKYNNKMIFATDMNKIKVCQICLDTKLNIPFDCFHWVCCDCYIYLDKCPICK